MAPEKKPLPKLIAEIKQRAEAAETLWIEEMPEAEDRTWQQDPGPNQNPESGCRTFFVREQSEPKDVERLVRALEVGVRNLDKHGLVTAILEIRAILAGEEEA
jgi:hypothetical protein